MPHMPRIDFENETRRELGQYFTPVWVADRIVETFFPELDETCGVIEPSCGGGAFLQAIPAHVPAIGVELDPRWAREARRMSGREVHVGDFTSIELDFRATHIIGNPPYQTALVEKFLDRSAQLLPEGGRVGMILPAYMFQTPSRVMRWNETWSLSQEMLPRTIFGQRKGDSMITKPIVFAMFSKDSRRMMSGFALYRETHDVSTMPEKFAEILREHGGSVWRAAVIHAMAALGGEARLDDIYEAVAPRRPSGSLWWREKVRQVLRTQPFSRTGEATYALAS